MPGYFHFLDTKTRTDIDLFRILITQSAIVGKDYHSFTKHKTNVIYINRAYITALSMHKYRLMFKSQHQPVWTIQ